MISVLLYIGITTACFIFKQCYYVLVFVQHDVLHVNGVMCYYVDVTTACHVAVVIICWCYYCLVCYMLTVLYVGGVVVVDVTAGA